MDEPAGILHEWVESYQAIVFRAAFLILRDEDAAGDVAQDTFVRAWQSQRRPEGGMIRPWLYRIAVNLSLNHLRKLRRESVAIGRLDGERLIGDPTEASDTTSVVADSIERLPNTLRVAVICRYYLDLSEQETARALGVRPGTVKSRLNAARRMLADDTSLAVAAGRT